MYWVNGQQQQSINVSDRAVQFGDGCFTTLAVEQGNLFYYLLTLNVYKRGCDALFLPSPDWQWLASHLLQIASNNH
ncbi:aminotransferase class IV [Proteus mirabilis]|uniref:hypothetical protein n=1 Tax=Proteus mirabilis TaxID=584 RepID=UPI000AB7A846|nr:hypothetical protein [Proteus mirabilis]